MSWYPSLVSYPDTMYSGKGKPPTKLMPIRKGPMKVVERNKDAYSVLDIVSRRIHEVHISRLFPFFYDDTRVDPETIALRDSEEFVVESIIDDTIDTEIPKTQWQFRIRWKGYDESEDTWVHGIHLNMSKRYINICTLMVLINIFLYLIRN